MTDKAANRVLMCGFTLHFYYRCADVHLLNLMHDLKMECVVSK